MNDIDELIDGLNWHNEINVQQAAICNLSRIVNDDNIQLLVQPRDDKACWENAGLVLKEIGYPGIKKVIPDLFEWISDMNWPGAEIVLNLLATIDKQTLRPYIESAQNKATRQNDEMWLDAINWLLDLLADR